MSAWSRLVRRIVGLPPVPEVTPFLVSRDGYKPVPDKLGTPPTGGSGVMENRTYSDPLSDAVTMAIIIGMASQNNE